MLPFSQLDVSMPKPIGHGYTKAPQTIGNHLRNKRLLLKLRQYQVADILGVVTDTLRFWETRSVMPQWEYFPKIIEFLGYIPVPIDVTTVVGKIQLCCMLNGFSKVELCRNLGIGFPRFAAWEQGESEPSQKVKVELEGLLSNPKPQAKTNLIVSNN